MRRNISEVENDVKRIQKASKKAKSFEEIAELLGLSMNQVRASLKDHPIIHNRVKEALKANRSSAVKEETDEPPQKKIVIDTSICGNTVNRLNQFLNTVQAREIIILSVVLRELERLQNATSPTDSSMNARHILAYAVKNPENIVLVKIPEEKESPDDNILEFCKQNKNRIILFTADKAMYLKAKMYKIEATYMEIQQQISKKYNKGDNKCKIATLYQSYYLGGKLAMSLTETEFRSIIKISKEGIEYRRGVVQLENGDNIYIINKSFNTLKIIHFRVIAETLKNNCEFVFSAKIKNAEEIKKTPAKYKGYLREFWRKKMR